MAQNIYTLGFFGDSTTAGDVGGFGVMQNSTSNSRLGNWTEELIELLADLPNIGPVIGSGIRVINNVTAEFDLSGGGWTTLSFSDTDAVTPFGIVNVNSTTGICTWNVSKIQRPVIGFAVYYVDGTSCANGQYSTNGGSTWTSWGQTFVNDHKIHKFYVPTALGTTNGLRLRANGNRILPYAFEAFYEDPTDPNLTGIIGHNYGYDSQQLIGMTASTSPDHMSVIDTIQYGTGSPLHNDSDLGLVGFTNDVLYNNTTTWDTALHKITQRLQGIGSQVLLWNIYVTNRNETNQANYRTTLTARAATDNCYTFDQAAFWALSGLTTNALTSAAGYLDAQGLHQSQEGMMRIAHMMYWYIKEAVLGITQVSPVLAISSSIQTSYAFQGSFSTKAMQGGVPLEPTRDIT